ncbi:hypothetical protein K8S19_03205 [bacterium]|nr:hypothetical protein [bacterium]
MPRPDGRGIFGTLRSLWYFCPEMFAFGGIDSLHQWAYPAPGIRPRIRGASWASPPGRMPIVFALAR